MATLNDVIERLKKEGDLNRNKGTWSNKTLADAIYTSNDTLELIDRKISTSTQGDTPGTLEESNAIQLNGEQGDGDGAPSGLNDILNSLSFNIEELGNAVQDDSYVTQGGVNELKLLNNRIEQYMLEQGFAAQEMAEAVKEGPDVSKAAPSAGAAGGGGQGGGISVGLGGMAAVAGIAALAGVAAAVAGFLAFDASAVKANVLELLSIGDAVEARGGSFIGEGATFLAAMTGIGLGLAVFGVGQAIAGIGGGMTAVLENFTDGTWAGNIKRSVLQLLSISDDLDGAGAFIGDSAAFLLAMTGLGLGLAAFSLGQGVAAIGGGMSAVLENFTDGTWAGNIKRSVLTLLSIKDELGGNLNMLLDSGGFVAAMGMISAGLIAFAFGEGATAVSGLAQEALSFFTGQDMVTGIKQKVLGLLEIGEMTNAAQLGDFLGTMTMLAAGLAVFGGSTFFDAIGRGAGALVDWLSGTENPLTTIKYLIDNKDEMIPAAEGLTAIAFALREFNNIDLSDFRVDIEDISDSLRRMRSDSVMFNVGTNLIASAATVGGEGPAMSFNINAPTTASGGTTLNVVGNGINVSDSSNAIN